ncbi:carboxypeptidase-like regulatory domain-containing protein [Variovorax sp. J22P240]|uniref:carboxypeptidase-like regulatory domain-containing protein n=1 Tax=Variovorax sp. J22P240 TaxID=3053514 RepID=UPI0025782F59|nr:carboxypeptidase-like regulatory domain-containing protein [Variovorax sp. J22P240]MDM0002535.1 carboxypeptidase-like regulatory domain-containing protein [Variovorax sp. J22P240]
MHASFRFILRGTVVCACAVAPWVVQAQSAAVPAVVPVVSPTMKSDGSGQYVCGGVGSDESVAMRAAMKDHPLSLLFARASGAYLADVAVTVKNASGATALSLVSNGPICHVDLPPGRYTVEAASEGVTKSQVVTLGGGSKTADFRF